MKPLITSFCALALLTPWQLQAASPCPPSPTPDTPGYYGQGESASFHKALAGDNEIPPEDEAALARLLPMSDLNRFYGRFSFNMTQLKIEKIHNRSLSSDYFYQTVRNTEFSSNKTAISAAIGYITKGARFDLEYFFNRNLPYNPNPVVTGSAASLQSTVKVQTFLLNGYYEWRLAGGELDPYVTLGLGLGMQRTNSALYNGNTLLSSANYTIYRPAWSVGAGVRFRLYSRFFFDANYRYAQLGSVEWRPQANLDFDIRGRVLWNGLTLGVICLI